jgi:hypothetical protein
MPSDRELLERLYDRFNATMFDPRPCDVVYRSDRAAAARVSACRLVARYGPASDRARGVRFELPRMQAA